MTNTTLNIIVNILAGVVVVPLLIAWIFRRPRWAFLGAGVFGIFLGCVVFALGLWFISLREVKTGAFELPLIVFGLLLLVGAVGLFADNPHWNIFYALTLITFGITINAINAFLGLWWGVTSVPMLVVAVAIAPILYGVHILLELALRSPPT